MRLIFLLVLAWVSTPVFAATFANCFTLTQPPKPVFSKRGSETYATYTVTGVVRGLATFGKGSGCQLKGIPKGGGTVIDTTVFGYIPIIPFTFTNVSSTGPGNCTHSLRFGDTVWYVEPTVAVQKCVVTFNLFVKFIGSYDGSNPLTDILLNPALTSQNTTPGGLIGDLFTAIFDNPIPVPPEPARTCSLTHPSVVIMPNTSQEIFGTRPAVFLSATIFSVTLSCQETTTARSGTPKLIFSFPSELNTLCGPTNQAALAVASSVKVVIRSSQTGSFVCGDSAINQTIESFADFNGTGPYTSTLNYSVGFENDKTQPTPGLFSASLVLEVQYP